MVRATSKLMRICGKVNLREQGQETVELRYLLPQQQHYESRPLPLTKLDRAATQQEANTKAISDLTVGTDSLRDIVMHLVQLSEGDWLRQCQRQSRASSSRPSSLASRNQTHLGIFAGEEWGQQHPQLTKLRG